jgi:hypothetical protein
VIFALRRIAGWVAVWAYLVMGAIIYFRVIPGAAWHWPPDFHLLGYDAESIAPFLSAISDPARDGYLRVLSLYDRVFIVALALWMALLAWRGSGLRYFVAGLAVVYAGVDLTENKMLLDVMRADAPTAAMISAAHHLTMAKFAALYLCVLVLIVHLRRST